MTFRMRQQPTSTFRISKELPPPPPPKAPETIPAPIVLDKEKSVEQQAREQQPGLPRTPSELSPEQQAEYNKIVAEEEKALAAIQSSIDSQRQTVEAAQKSVDSILPAGSPDEDKIRASAEYQEAAGSLIDAQNLLRDYQNQYEALGRSYAEKRLATAGYTFASTGPTTTEIAKAHEQTAMLAKGGKEAFDYALKEGLIKDKDAIFIDQGKGKWAYTTPAKQNDALIALSKAGVIKTDELSNYDINTDLTAKLDAVVARYNLEHVQNQLSTLASAGLMTTAEIDALGDLSDTAKVQAKLQPYIEKYNADVKTKQDIAKRLDESPFNLGDNKYNIAGALQSGTFTEKDLTSIGFNESEVKEAAQVQPTPITITEAPTVIGAQRYENEAELRAYGQSLATTNPDLFKVFKESFASGNWGAFDQAVRTYNDQIEAEDKQFKASHTQLADGQWMANKDLQDIKAQSPVLYNDVLAKGYDKTIGFMSDLKTKNPNLYVFDLQKYNLVPQNTQYFDTLPDGTIRVVDKDKPDFGPKTIGELAKKIGGDIADAFVPGVWARNLKIERQPDGTFTSNIPAWEIGLNAGLDLAVIVPGVGWAAKGVGKQILKAGTTTIEKSLTKNLAKDLIKAGEKDLAAEAVKVGKIAPQINKAAVNLENASRKAAEATFYRDIPKMAKTYKVEAAAKTELVNKMQSFGNDLAELNAKVGATAVKGAGKDALTKTVGMAAQAPDFAEYIAGSAKDLRTAELSSKYFGKVTPVTGAKVAGEIKNTIRQYTELPKTIGEVATASKIAVTPEKLSINQLSKMTNDDWIKWGQKVWKGQDIPSGVVEIIKSSHGTGQVLGQFSKAGGAPIIKIAKFTNPREAIKTYLHELGHARTLTKEGRKSIEVYIGETLAPKLNSFRNISEARYAIGEMAAEHAMRIQGLSPTGKDYIKAYRTIIARISDKQTAKEAEKFALSLAKKSVKVGPQVELRVFGKQIITGKPTIEFKSGLPKAAAFLRGETATIGRVKTPTEIAAMGKKEADKYLANLQKQLAKEATINQARAEKYLGKQTALDKWDKFIKDNWNPKTGVIRDITKPLPHSFGGGGASVATVSTATMTSEQAARLGLTPKQAESFVLRGLGGKAIFTIITEPDGTTRIIRESQPFKSAPEKIGRPTIKPIKPGVKPSVRPVTTPAVKPSKITPGKITPIEPLRVPIKAPEKLPSPVIVPKPSIVPGKIPEKAPAKAPSKTPIKEPFKAPTPEKTKLPIKTPAPVPSPAPIKAPKKAPVKAPVKTPIKTKVKLPVRLFLPRMTDAEKREAIKKAGGAFYWQQGQLHGKKVYHVGVVTEGKVIKTTVLGKPPEGAIRTEGKGQAKRTIRVTRGDAPKSPVRIEGGAIDVVVSPAKTARKVLITFTRDPRYLTRSGRAKVATKSPFSSRKRGKIIETRIAGRMVLSRRSLRRRR